MIENLKTTPGTEKKNYAFNNAPRCGAKTRAGTPCQSPAIPSWRTAALPQPLAMVYFYKLLAGL